MSAPSKFVSDILPGTGRQTDDNLYGITRALNRLQASAARSLRTVDLTNSNDRMQTTDNTVIFTASGATASFTFAASRTMLTSIVALVNNGANPVTITASSADDVIDTATVPAGSRYWFQSDGAGKWYRII